MSGNAVNRGGVRFEFRPDVEPRFGWRAAMRGHGGIGPTAEAAAADLIESIERELATAKDGAASLHKPAEQEPS